MAANDSTFPMELVPVIAGQFNTFERWVNKASSYLSPRRGNMGEPVSPICVDMLGRRCNVGADFMRARDEGTFPVFFFWECRPAGKAEQ